MPGTRGKGPVLNARNTVVNKRQVLTIKELILNILAVAVVAMGWKTGICSDKNRKL